MQTRILIFASTCCFNRKKNVLKESQDCSKMSRDAPNCCASAAIFFVTIVREYKFSSKGLSKRPLEGSGDGPTVKYRQVLDKAVVLKSTHRKFKTINLAVATYKKSLKKDSAIFTQNRRLNKMEYKLYL